MEKNARFSLRLQEAEDLLSGGDPAAAENAFRALLPDAPPPSPTRARALNGLGRCLHALSRNAEAEQSFMEALDLLRATFGPRHPHVSGGFQNLTRLRTECGAMEEDMEALEAAQVCHERLGRADGEEAAICLGNLRLCRDALAAAGKA